MGCRIAGEIEMAEYSIHLHPPEYPVGCFPGRCAHGPQYVMSAQVRLGSYRKPMEIDHTVCLACGLSRPSAYGGNIFVDLHHLWEKLGWHAAIGGRIIVIRGKWARIATYLFGDNGWNGRHERIARLIDPNLTMRLQITEDGHGGRLGQVSADPEYFRPPEA